jgi:AcrR family transcriptional regulator
MAKDTRRKILDIAQKLFAQKGYEGCSVDLIADKAKVNKASIYYHFKDKASLYENVLEENLDRFLQRVIQAVAGEDSPEKKLEAFASSYAENFVSNRAMAPLMLRELASDGTHLTAKTRAALGHIIQVVDDILREGRDSGVFKETKTFLPYFMIVGSMNIYTSTRKMRKKFQDQEDSYGFSLSPQETDKEIASIVINGLKK